MNEIKQNMAPQNSTLINLINDDIKSITSERLSPIQRELSCSDSEDDIDEEIPIYIGSIPRYVSGINRKTTCNDIIKALIDDELANTKVSKQLMCEPQHYTIYERFQDIEHALGSDELIYDLWQNWGDNRHDVQFRLKINKEKEQEETLDSKAKAKKLKNTGIKKLLKKVLHQGEIIQKHLQDINKVHEHAKYSEHSDDYDDERNKVESLLPTHLKWDNQTVTDTEDELFLVIESHNDNDSGVFITKEQKFFHEMDVDQPKDLPATPKRKFRYSRDFGSLQSHAINTFNPQENFSRASFKFELVHKEIRSKMDGMKEIIEQEHSFLRKIDKCSFDDEDREDFFEDNRRSFFIDNRKDFLVDHHHQQEERQAKGFLQTDFDYFDDNEYCDTNTTMIV